MKEEKPHEVLPHSTYQPNGAIWDQMKSDGNAVSPPTMQLKVGDGNKHNNSEIPHTRNGALPSHIQNNAEALSGFSLDHVNVHYNSDQPSQLNAHAFAQGSDIHLASGQEKHLPHEAWHVVQQMQGRVSSNGEIGTEKVNNDPSLENEADNMASKLRNSKVNSVNSPYQLKKSNDDSNSNNIQRKVRTGGGAKKVDEKKYQLGGSKESAGSKHKVSDLINDNVKRVFTSENEMENYANGATDYIGDVQTASNGTFWYRLPASKLTVLGEGHGNENGNVPDVILGIGTSRFKYEPYNEMESVRAINSPHTSTEDRLNDIEKGRRVAPNVDEVNFDPSLENIVVKAMTGCGIMKNEFMAENPKSMKKDRVDYWSGRPTTSDYSYGERTALYFSMAVHIAKDLSLEKFGPPTFVERGIITAGRNLVAFYNSFKFFFDHIKDTKDADDLIGIYELTDFLNFLALPVFEEFCKLFHVYGANYIQELGSESGNKELVKEGKKLEGNSGAKVDYFHAAREEVMWNKVLEAQSSGYLIVGMGDRHRQNLLPRLKKAGIRQEETQDSLEKQKRRINSKWK